jgi:hypothetical protein
MLRVSLQRSLCPLPPFQGAFDDEFMEGCTLEECPGKPPNHAARRVKRPHLAGQPSREQ